jgi:hypothetical protein
MSQPLRITPLAVSFTSAANQLGLGRERIGGLVADGRLRTVVLPGSKRPKVLQASIDKLFAEIYQAEPLAV